MNKCSYNNESGIITPRKKAEKDGKPYHYWQKSNGKGKAMYSVEKLSQLFELKREGKIDLFTIKMQTGLKKSQLYKLYSRFKSGKALYEARGHREKLFDDKKADIIRQTYRELAFGAEKLMPSMLILKTIVEMENLEFPIASIETYRKTVLDMLEYPAYEGKQKRYRKRFRAPAIGMLIQGDVTSHEWIEGAEPFSLLAFIDDHSRRVLYAKFIENDNLEAHIEALKEIFKTYGLPWAIYYDNDSKYRKRQKELELNPLIVRGCKSLDVDIINSEPYMPQGKGKIESKFRVFQEQLIFFLKRKRVKSWEKAQEVLDWYIDWHNNQKNRDLGDTPENVFKNGEDRFRDIKAEDLVKIDNALTKIESREVSGVNEISYNGEYYSVPSVGNKVFSGCRIEVRENPGKWIRLFYRGLFIVEHKLKNKLEESNAKQIA
jgi:transposase InsO family protein